MQTLKHEHVIVGTGFAGRTVANLLEPGSYVVLERGEDREYPEMYSRFQDHIRGGGGFHDAENLAYGSDLPWNLRPQLSRWNYSKYGMVRGGASNWWGGNTRRCSRETFESHGPIHWPFTYDDLVPHYEAAERLLNVCGDECNPVAPAPTPMPGAEYWRTAFDPYFEGAYLSSVALNKRAAGLQGLCKGRSQCTICREDAKARPDNIFPEQETLYEAFVNRILFQGDVATGVECYDGKQLFVVECDKLVVAANGIETPRIFGRSELPKGVRRESIGRFYQDHGHLEISCKIDKPLLYGNVGGLSHVHLPQISSFYSGGEFGPIEISAFALTHEPSHETFLGGMNVDLLRRQDLRKFMTDLQGCFQIFCELEIPPSAGFYVDLESDEPRVVDHNYPHVIEAFDDVVRQVVTRLTGLGVSVLGMQPRYRDGYNSHHFTGTMNCSSNEHGVVDENMRVIGTRNVYVAGSSVMPRAGGHGPTLTIVALADRLGKHLAGLP
jgi:choline dehydrogenase-like flavoprotein